MVGTEERRRNGHGVRARDREKHTENRSNITANNHLIIIKRQTDGKTI